MNRTAYLLGVCVAGLPLAAHADVSDCTRIESDAERLACYDALFRTQAEDIQAAGDEFGAEDLEQRNVDRLEARLAGDFTGWTGKTEFRLDNGQVWRQTNNYIRPYKPRNPIPQPQVTITKGAFGSYNMQIEGVKRIVQVKRVK